MECIYLEEENLVYLHSRLADKDAVDFSGNNVNEQIKEAIPNAKLEELALLKNPPSEHAATLL